MKLLTFCIFIISGASLMQCKNEVGGKPVVDIEPFGYYSDYYVFLADDGGDPLIIPIDINWYPLADGYEVEYKGWYGTEQDWPIVYRKKIFKTDVADIPKESFEQTNTDYFSFNAEKKSINMEIDGAPIIEFIIPNKSEWVLAPLNSKIHDTYAFRTSISVDGKSRSGWMLYEKIRQRQDSEMKFEGFESFYWMPIVVSGDLYHFMEHRDEQAAVRWSEEEGNIRAEILRSFNLDVIERVADSISQRKAIPKAVQIQVPEWDIDIKLKSWGEQVGYGKEFPKGLAYYRQSILRSTDSSVTSGYGMMELILENNN